jgi:hypothetical protein
MEDQIAMTLLGVMEQDMSILIAEEAGSSSALRVKHHRRYVNCDHEAAHLRLHHDYFNDDCDYPPPSYFCTWYHMQRSLFLHIMHKLGETSPYFTERHDGTGHIGLTLLQ